MKRRKTAGLFCAGTALALLLCSCGGTISDKDVADTVTDIGDTVADAAEDIGEAVEHAIIGETDPHILGVKGGTNPEYPDTTYEDAFENFFGNPVWTYFEGHRDDETEQYDVVQFEGDCMYKDTEVRALIQFELDMDEGTFEPVFLSFNEVPQDRLTLNALIGKAFEEAPVSSMDEPFEPVSDEAEFTDVPLPGEWADEDNLYEMTIEAGDPAYITIRHDYSEEEWRMWNLEGPIEESGTIAYTGNYVDLYLEPAGTVGGGGIVTETSGMLYQRQDGALCWDADDGEPEDTIVFLKK